MSTDGRRVVATHIQSALRSMPGLSKMENKLIEFWIKPGTAASSYISASFQE